MKRHIKVMHPDTARSQIALEEKRQKRATKEQESTGGGDSDVGKGEAGGAGADGETKRRENKGGASSGAGTCEGTEGHCAEETL